MSKVIVCDKCKHEGCNVSEIRPKSEHISMKDFAAQGKSPHGFPDSYQCERRDRKWEVTCPECNYSLTFIEYAPRSMPMFQTG